MNAPAKLGRIGSPLPSGGPRVFLYGQSNLCDS
jgi:hypothetical protein